MVGSPPRSLSHPTCRGHRHVLAASRTEWQRHLGSESAQSLSHGNRLEASFFYLGEAMRLAPARRGAKASGASPRDKTTVIAASCSRTVVSAAGVRASSRCWALRPDGPGTVPVGKLRSILRTTSGLMSGGNIKSPRRLQGGKGARGWRSCKISREAAFGATKPDWESEAQAFPSRPSRAYISQRAICLGLVVVKRFS
jgi:hypothetical protein